jgi:DNA-binding GntR family transcriptional regulator
MDGAMGRGGGERIDIGPVPAAMPEARSPGGVRELVTAALREALNIGRIQPGRPVTLRGLATALGVSPMPVREAVRGLAAEKALDISASGRIAVPRMTEARFGEILEARALLEPRTAALAMRQMTREVIRQLEKIDHAIDLSLETGDVEGYMRLNHAFHFTLYRQSRSDVFLPLIESVWLRFGPFMRMVYGRVGTAGLVDHHKQAIRAAGAGDAVGLAESIRRDIHEGMSLIGEALKAEAEPRPQAHRRRAASGQN